MSKVVLKAEDISKQYRLGLVGTGTVKDDMKRWWYKLRGMEDPFLKIGEANDRSTKGESDYVWSLRDINFEINQGDSVGIIGRNGAGKSTLLKILSQVTQPTTGKIYTKGRIASLLEVGTGFHPEMTGRENIYLNGAILGMRKKEITRKLDEIIDFSGVERYIDTPVKRYSSGMYVRLAFAVAAHLESEILIVDEVLAVGDAEFQKKCLGKMGDVSKGEGRTVLFVSHNMLAVKSLCNSGILLSNGKIENIGKVESVIDNYLITANNLLQSFAKIEKESNGFSLHSISVTNNSNNGNFDISEDLVFEIKARSVKTFEGINVNIFFNTLDGVNVFATCSDSEKLIEGSYSFKCVVPKKTLNDIIYSIDLMVVEVGPKVLHHVKEILIIEGVENNREGAWLDKFPGLIRPQYFEWIKVRNDE
ncbi:polysaccharide ABC transporter ATP-binding protein [Flavobacterium sp.]|jgi:lipopolysaccharide transport system ATP-binding protein|uniref:polysaccharide ABC transporter ATP-binding protein n=1 Tax=Flavobacterium sp. TaxID=239 RepID=UPI0037BEF472